VGPKSLGVALLTAGFVGMVFTIQVGRQARAPAILGCCAHESENDLTSMWHDLTKMAGAGKRESTGIPRGGLFRRNCHDTSPCSLLLANESPPQCTCIKRMTSATFACALLQCNTCLAQQMMGAGHAYSLHAGLCCSLCESLQSWGSRAQWGA